MNITALKKSDDQAPLPQEIADGHEKKPYERREGESAMWYNRFLLYRSLGYKRTLQATVETERQRMQALQSTEIEQKATHKGKDVQVPGSWKQASRTFQWVARAHAWDEHIIERYTQKNMEFLLGHELANTLGRVSALQGLYDVAKSLLNNNSKNMSFEQINMVLARMQSLTIAIREEMKFYDETFTRLGVKRHITRNYQEKP